MKHRMAAALSAPFAQLVSLAFVAVALVRRSGDLGSRAPPRPRRFLPAVPAETASNALPLAPTARLKRARSWTTLTNTCAVFGLRAIGRTGSTRTSSPTIPRSSLHPARRRPPPMLAMRSSARGASIRFEPVCRRRTSRASSTCCRSRRPSRLRTTRASARSSRASRRG